jgi:hypothetical protein
MAHYAKVVKDIVFDVVVADKEWIDLQEKVSYVEWVETSYNIYGGIYYDIETKKPHKNQNLINESAGRKRKNYAGIGWQYDKQRDAFIPPQLFASWVLNEETCLWEAPIPRPEDNKEYMWNEIHKEWIYTGYYINENGELRKEV